MKQKKNMAVDLERREQEVIDRYIKWFINNATDAKEFDRMTYQYHHTDSPTRRRFNTKWAKLTTKAIKMAQSPSEAEVAFWASPEKLRHLALEKWIALSETAAIRKVFNAAKQVHDRAAADLAWAKWHLISTQALKNSRSVAEAKEVFENSPGADQLERYGLLSECRTTKEVINVYNRVQPWMAGAKDRAHQCSNLDALLYEVRFHSMEPGTALIKPRLLELIRARIRQAMTPLEAFDTLQLTYGCYSGNIDDSLTLEALDKLNQLMDD
ncbi:MAG: hypothetical protein WCG99_01590 [Candidatus Berkelbacteria bacterium]